HYRNDHRVQERKRGEERAHRVRGRNAELEDGCGRGETQRQGKPVRGARTREGRSTVERKSDGQGGGTPDGERDEEGVERRSEGKGLKAKRNRGLLKKLHGLSS